jgi:hypothetical protein
VTLTIARALKRHRARDLYWDIGMDASRITAQLYTASDPADRAYLLGQLADYEQQLADLHPAAFGADPNPDENGRDLAESLGSSATLLHALAATEDGNVGRLNQLLGTVDLVESILWRRLASTRNHGERSELIGDIANLAANRVGGQAVQRLLEGFYSEHELATAAIEGRPAKAPHTMKVPRVVITLVFLALGAVIVLNMLLNHHH